MTFPHGVVFSCDCSHAPASHFKPSGAGPPTVVTLSQGISSWDHRAHLLVVQNTDTDRLRQEAEALKSSFPSSRDQVKKPWPLYLIFFFFLFFSVWFNSVDSLYTCNFVPKSDSLPNSSPSVQEWDNIHVSSHFP